MEHWRNAAGMLTWKHGVMELLRRAVGDTSMLSAHLDHRTEDAETIMTTPFCEQFAI